VGGWVAWVANEVGPFVARALDRCLEPFSNETTFITQPVEKDAAGSTSGYMAPLALADAGSDRINDANDSGAPDVVASTLT
jgi:hypothetical protein